jgi:hypothetical protein
MGLTHPTSRDSDRPGLSAANPMVIREPVTIPKFSFPRQFDADVAYQTAHDELILDGRPG